jgi:hypothetical protein
MTCCELLFFSLKSPVIKIVEANASEHDVYCIAVVASLSMPGSCVLTCED